VGPVASSSSTAVSQSLAVVEEKDEAMVSRLEDLEDNVDRLNAIIKETEVCLLQAQNDVQSRVEHIEVLEQELVLCNQEIEDLKKEKQLTAEETVKAQTELAALSSKATEQSRTHDAKVNALEDALHEKRRMEEQLNFAKDDLSIQVKRLEHQLNEKDSTVQALADDLTSKNEKIRELQDALKQCSADNAAQDVTPTHSPSTFKVLSDENYTVYPSPPTFNKMPSPAVANGGSGSKMERARRFQTVTQTLHIPPNP